MQQNWVYSHPEWWISAIRRACAENGCPHCSDPSPESYFPSISDGLIGTLRYLSATPNLKSSEVRRSLFYAKALKKWRLPLDPAAALHRKEKAMAGFSERNAAIRLDPAAYIPLVSDEMRRVLKRWLPEPDRNSYMWFGRFGPGACAERLTHPMRFIRLTEWCDAGMVPDSPTDFTCHADWLCTPVSRLCAVPKDWDKDRLITVEPALSTYQQQWVRSLILDSIHSGPLRGTAMDLGYTDGQAIQRRLALTASRTGQDATIDLSDASDRISWEAVQATFPSWVVDLLWSSRTPYFEKQISGKTRNREILHIFAGMGNATTFAIETLFFSAYVVAEQKVHGLKPWVSTFGDDIIVDSGTVELLLSEGIHAFFKINVAKSFWGAMRIRESCGIFAYSGEDVTVPKVDGYPPCWEGRLGLADLHRRLVSSGDLFQVLLAHEIASLGLLDNWPFLVDGYPSIMDWSAEFSALPRSRYNTFLQRREVMVKVAKPKTVSYPCEDLFVEEASDLGWVPDRRQAMQLYRRRRFPDARIWLDGVLSGACSTDPSIIDGRSHGPRSRVSFPTGRHRVTSAWCCTTEV